MSSGSLLDLKKVNWKNQYSIGFEFPNLQEFAETCGVSDETISKRVKELIELLPELWFEGFLE